MKHVIITAIFMITACNLTVAENRDVSNTFIEPGPLETEFAWLTASEGRIGGQAYIHAKTADQPVLIIVLHGDLLQVHDTYHYAFARTVAAGAPDVVAVGLLRPGYSDEFGNRSDGDSLNATGDNYTADAVEAVAFATRQLKAQYDSRATVLVGHSGGAAVAALVLGRHPDVADAALLVACPCDLRAWRAHMMDLRPHPVWEQPHQGLSPMDAVSGVRESVRVELMLGGEDEVVRAAYSLNYGAALQNRGVEANVTILPSSGHNILQKPAVADMTKQLIAHVQAAGYAK